MKSILIKLDVVQYDDDEQKTIKDYIELIIGEEVYKKLPYNQPRKSLCLLSRGKP